MLETEIQPKHCQLHILSVEDDVTTQELYRDILLNEGHQVAQSRTAENALEIIHTAAQDHNPIDVIYLDINLPGMSGFDFCRRIRNQSLQNKAYISDLWIVAVTSLTEPADITKLLQSGANDYLPKPLNPTTIISKTLVCQYQRARTLSLRKRITYLEKEIISQANTPKPSKTA